MHACVLCVHVLSNVHALRARDRLQCLPASRNILSAVPIFGDMANLAGRGGVGEGGNLNIIVNNLKLN